ncbi:hypothetical protein ACTZWW_04035 [Salinarimonas sp. NSM]|uniref:hypothetical protein n=1 Tax=Salinarimonas sp. NSM TaxID=3458003 RepID=UPI004037566A
MTTLRNTALRVVALARGACLVLAMVAALAVEAIVLLASWAASKPRAAMTPAERAEHDREAWRG